MVTGIEAAGLALGLFPLVIEGVKFYISFAQKFREAKHYKHTLDQFRRDLKMEGSKLKNIWYILVDRAGVLIKPNSELSPKMMEEILSCLPSWAVESVVNSLQELHTILIGLKQKFHKHAQDKAGYRQMLGILLNFTQEHREQYLKRIEKLNSNLHQLVNGTAAVEAHKSRKVNVARQFQRVREHATTLYGALKEKLQISSCPCEMPHSANLQLNVCTLGTHNSSYNNDAPGMRRLSLLFPVSAEQAKTEEYLTLRELEFENLENPDSAESASNDMKILSSELPPHLNFDQDPITLQLDAAYTSGEQKTEPDKDTLVSSVFSKLSPRNLLKKTPKNVKFCPSVAETLSSCIASLVVPSPPERKIESLCSTIRNIAEVCTCVGVLVSNNSKHLVWDPRAPLAKLASARVISLDKLLSRPEPPRIERLKLGVRLASSVLQLHRTEWLQERWGKQDIYLIQGDSSQSSSPSLETPVVHQSFTPDPPILEASIESRIISCNLSLFSLGIVLIELWFWRSEESFQAHKPQPYCCPEDLDTARFVTARRLIDRLYEDAGEDYGSIIRRCIIGLDHRETQLENDGFKNEVYLKVLQPLESHLELFCGKSLGEIFRKQVS